MDLTGFISHAGLWLGYLLIFGIIFAESGLLIGFFLPGDSLLFGLGLLTSQGHFSLPIVIILGCLGAITGDSVGYAFGRRIGPSLLHQPDTLLFKKKYIHQAQEFYEKHGKSTIIIARFSPVVRTFAPIIAGIAGMPYKTFRTYNIIGGTAWIITFTFLGYFLGAVLSRTSHYLEVAILVITVLSFTPSLMHLKSATKKKPVEAGS